MTSGDDPGGGGVLRTALQVNWFQREPGGTTTYVAPVLQYRTSSRCGSGGCVAVAPLTDGGAVVRSTLDPDRVLRLTVTQRSELLELAKGGLTGRG